MIVTKIDGRYQTPPAIQPMGWASNAYRNAAAQARQEADGQRRRADRLAATNRRLTLHLAWLMTAVVGVGAAMLLLGLVLGAAVASGLIGLVTP